MSLHDRNEPDDMNPRRAWRILTSMGVTYGFGTFNDNFFKQAALLLAATAQLYAIQGLAALLFALPFVLFSAWAGWLADAFPKRNLIIGSKILELVIMLFGVWALYAISWGGMLGVIFFMGLQSTVFSPALNSAIPEHFPPCRVPHVNAVLKLATTLTILLAIALGGLALDVHEPLCLTLYVIPSGLFGFGRLLVGVAAVLVACVGLASAFAIPKSPAFSRCSETLPTKSETPLSSPTSLSSTSTPTTNNRAPFPLYGPVDSFRHVWAYRREDAPLFLALMAEAFFYGLSSFVVLCINNLGVAQLGLSVTLTSLLAVALMVGICIGASIAGRQKAEAWQRILLPAALIMGLGLVASAFSPWIATSVLRTVYASACFIVAGIGGGLYLIPTVSFMQIRPRASEKGKVMGISGFASFSAIILSGALFSASGAVRPSLLLVGAGVSVFVFMAWARSYQTDAKG